MLATYPMNFFHLLLQMRSAQEDFVRALHETKLIQCSECHSVWFRTGRSRQSICEQCRRLNKTVKKHVLATRNNMNPFPGPLLKRVVLPPPLNEIEEMLIAQAYPIMKIFRLENGTTAGQGHILNVEQDIRGVEDNVFPPDPFGLPVLVVKRPNTTMSDNLEKVFRVRKVAVRQWLTFLKEHHPEYKDILISDARLNELPDDGSIEDSLRPATLEQAESIVTELSNRSQRSEPVEPTNQPTRVFEDIPDSLAENNNHDDDNLQQPGPEQGGATGLQENELPVTEEHIGIPFTVPNQRETIAETINRCLGWGFEPNNDNDDGNEGRMASNGNNNANNNNRAIAWPTAGKILSDYNTDRLQAKLFPTLFPFGRGDHYQLKRHTRVSAAESNRHLLYYALCDAEGNLSFPFAQHGRWPHWAHNTCERHRQQQQNKVFLKKNDRYANMTLDDLREELAEDGPARHRLIGKMRNYSANVNGSDAYLSKKREDLEGLIEQEGMPSIWFSMSAADNHWDDFFRLHSEKQPPHNGNYDGAQSDTQSIQDALELLGPPVDVTTRTTNPAQESREDTQPQTESDAARQRRKFVRDHPHLVDAWFLQRVKAFFRTIFGPKGLEMKWFWYRVEYQKRGTAHIHGCVRLKDDPGLTALSAKVRKGRMADRRLVADGDNPRIPAMETDGDVWIKSAEKPSTPDEKQNLIRDVEKGQEAHRAIMCFHDWLLTTRHPSPPRDATENNRREDTMFQQTDTNAHPSSVPLQDFVHGTDAFRSQQYCQLINAVQRHKCQGYCQRQKTDANGQTTTYCRFGFPKPIRINRSRMKIKESRRKNGQLRHSLEMESERNDSWLNSHLRVGSEVWMANCDVQLIIDPVKVVSYMTKYVTKADEATTKKTARLMRELMVGDNTDLLPASKLLNRVMSRVVGERCISKQETCHLISSLPIVVSSHATEHVNLKNDTAQLNLEGQGNTQGRNQSATKRSLLDMYADRMKEENWKDPHVVMPPDNLLREMCLVDFAKTFRVIRSGEFVDLIQPRASTRRPNVVVRYFPRMAGRPGTGEKYVEYCQYALARYIPWVGQIENSWGGSDTSDEDIVARWESVLDSFLDDDANAANAAGASQERVLPDVLLRLIDDHRQEMNERHDNDNDPNDLGTNMPYPTTDGAGETFENNNYIDGREGVDITTVCDGQHVDIGPDDVHRRLHDDGDDGFQPNMDVDCAALHHTYNDNFRADLPNEAKTRFKDARDTRARPVVDAALLNEAQRLAHDAIVHSATREVRDENPLTETDDDCSRLMILRGVGGTGKSFVINAVLSTLQQHHNFDTDEFMVLATTGKAATVIQGATVHSPRHGLALPIGTSSKKSRGTSANLSGESLQKLQDRVANVKLVFLDEFSMLKPSDLFYMDQRLREGRTKFSHLPFGGVTVVLCGDLGQLPPVLSTHYWWDDPLRDTKKDPGHQRDGLTLYRKFKTVFKLTEVRRIATDDADATVFREILSRLRDGRSTEVDWGKIHDNCVKTNMGETEWKNRGFSSSDVVHLYPTNEQVDNRNIEMLQQLGQGSYFTYMG